MNNIILCALTFFSCIFSIASYAVDFYKPSLYESEDGLKAYILSYESDKNAYLIKMTGTKTILDNTIIEVIKYDSDRDAGFVTLMYGSTTVLFNIYRGAFPQKLEFVNPDNLKKTVLSYDKLDTEDSKYSEKDMLREFKSQRNKDKFNAIKKFDRKRLEQRFEIKANEYSNKIADTCKTNPLPITIEWSKIDDKEMETWKTNYCFGNADSIDSFCRLNDENKKLVQANIKKFSCHPVKYDGRKQYIKLNEDEVNFFYTENTENVDQFMRDFLMNQQFSK